jgi:hypothetical protein
MGLHRSPPEIPGPDHRQKGREIAQIEICPLFDRVNKAFGIVQLIGSMARAHIRAAAAKARYGSVRPPSGRTIMNQL